MGKLKVRGFSVDLDEEQERVLRKEVNNLAGWSRDVASEAILSSINWMVELDRRQRKAAHEKAVTRAFWEVNLAEGDKHGTD